MKLLRRALGHQRVTWSGGILLVLALASLSAPLAGWNRLPYAQQWLDAHNVAPVARSRFDEFLKQNPAAARGAQSEADRDALFKQFQAWQTDQASKDTGNARAQVVRPSKQQ